MRVEVLDIGKAAEMLAAETGHDERSVSRDISVPKRHRRWSHLNDTSSFNHSGNFNLLLDDAGNLYGHLFANDASDLDRLGRSARHCERHRRYESK